MNLPLGDSTVRKVASRRAVEPLESFDEPGETRFNSVYFLPDLVPEASEFLCVAPRNSDISRVNVHVVLSSRVPPEY